MNPTYSKANVTTRYDMWNASYIAIIIFTILSVFAIIPLAWMVPMTLMTKRARDEVGTENEVQHIALGVCGVIFAGIVPGVFSLIATFDFGPQNHDHLNK